MSKEINLSEIDWNKLSIEEFHALEQELLTKQKILKSSQIKDRVSGFTNVSIHGNMYKIKTITYQRLKLMKSGKSKEKLIQEIINTHEIIPNI